MTTLQTIEDASVAAEAETYLASHPGARRQVHLLVGEARRVFGAQARIGVDLYRDHESGDSSAQVTVDAGLAFSDTFKLIDGILDRLSGRAEFTTSTEFVALLPGGPVEPR